MSYDEDDNGYSGGYNASSRSSGDTSNFNTTLLSNDGRFLGMKLSPEMASDFRKFYAVGLDWARRKGEQLGIPLAKKIAKAFGANKTKADHISQKAGDAIGYGIIFAPQITGVVRNIYDSTRCLNDLRVAVQPLTKAGNDNTAPLSGNNEVVANARSKISSIFWQRLLETGTSAIAALPALIFKLNEQKTVNRQRKTLHAIEEAEDPDKVADLLKEQMAGAGIGIGADAATLEKGAKRLIERERKAYEAACEAYVAQHEKAHAKKLRGILGTLSEKSYEVPLKKLKEQGINVRRLREQIESIRDHSANKAEATEHITRAIREFRERTTSDLKHYAGEALRGEYVGREGAFDDNWQRKYGDRDDDDYGRGYGGYGYNNRERKKTIKEGLEERIQKLRDAQEKAHEEDKHKDEKGDEISKMAAGLAAGLGSELITQKFIGKAHRKYSQPIALDRILHLRRKMEESKDSPPEQVPGIPAEKGPVKDVGYVQYVHDIFQQHQKDCGRTVIGERFTEHFDKARWDDAAIQQMQDDELTSYEYAVKTIAKRIKDGRMDAIALINLVGDKQKKIVRDDGRSFGPQGAGKDEAKVKDSIRKLIDEYAMILHGNQKQAEDDGSDNLGNVVFSVADMKKALTSGDLPPEERAFLFTSFSNIVGSDKKLCEMLGFNEEQCKKLRLEAKDHYHPMLDASVIVLAEMMEKNPALLEKIKATDKEKELLASFSQRIGQEGKDIVDLAGNRDEIKAVETIVTNAAMTLGKDKDAHDENGKPLWTRIVEKAQTIPQIIKEHRKRKEDPVAHASDIEPRAERMADMHKDGETSFADRRTFKESEDLPALSARDREIGRRKTSGEVQEIGA